MHKLRRESAPTCLQKFNSSNTWADLKREDRAAIWQALEAMQRKRCAYCEDRLKDESRHIEHFHRRSDHPETTFEWRNLFGSCNCEETCGKHKDNRAQARTDDLIKPDEDDPEHFFKFRSNGTVDLRDTLSEAENRRATNTRDAFNLNFSTLRAKRRVVALPYIGDAEALHQMLRESPEACQSFLEEEIAKTAGLPFATTIKHLLLG